jgi:hypothetical protein
LQWSADEFDANLRRVIFKTVYLGQFDLPVPDPLVKLLEVLASLFNQSWKVETFFFLKTPTSNRYLPSHAMADSTLAGYGGPDVNMGPKLLAATGVVTAFAFISVVLRMYVRAVMIKSVGWDDKFILMAMVSNLSRSRKHIQAAALWIY